MDDLDPMSQIEVESAMRRVMRDLVACTTDIAELAEDAAIAEHALKVRKAQFHLRCKAEDPKRTVSDLDALVSSHTEEDLFRHLVADAKLKAAQERSRNLRASLEALRSLAANVRTVVQG